MVNNYWKNRALMRKVKGELAGIKIASNVLPIYDEALENIRKEINSIYVKYSNKTGLDVGELGKILSGVDRKEYLKGIKVNMLKRGLKLEDFYDKNYISQLTRLEAIKQQIYWEIQGIAPRVNMAQNRGYEGIVRDSYREVREDIRLQKGGSVTFADMGKNEVNQVLNSTWEGGNYSTRTFGNIKGFAVKARNIIGGGLSIGMSSQKMARQIVERFDVAKYDAMRLIRTETNYFQNQAELQSYIDEDIEYYKVLAVADRCKHICAEKEGLPPIRVVDASVGDNFPPFHPNCRCSTLIVFDNEVKKEKTVNVGNKSDDMWKEIYETQMKGLVEQGFKRR